MWAARLFLIALPAAASNVDREALRNLRAAPHVQANDAKTAQKHPWRYHVFATGDAAKVEAAPPAPVAKKADDKKVAAAPVAEKAAEVAKLVKAGEAAKAAPPAPV
eukprot:CAMPEP_0183417022 /NCGR_PEP_ID=MMETSP0370-20130417/24154_1 /TAXON_ID=268820 /ORGANISM="Peridinium aciculiferum, Strain PAER-2" /LENGTH=105 /DNA_ID=CAMNT_0025600573 /DNA_START=67 /DNA_END=381 /DNA_ORIENTATION=-